MPQILPSLTITRLAIALLAIWLLLASAAVASAAEVEIPRARDLQATAALIREQGLPLLLIVSQRDCSYCKLLDREIIRPMILSGDYEDKVIIRELRIDPGEIVVDFDGREIDSKRVANRYKAWVTPTLLFLGPEGEELAPRRRGINTPDFYGFYVDKAIKQALLALNSTGE